MKKAKIAVLVSGGGTNLQALIDAQRDGIITHGEIGLVVSSKADAYALHRAQNADIETLVLPKKELGQSAFEEQLTKALEGFDLIILAGFMTILTEEFTRHFEGKIINVHPSLIPAFCGEGYYGLRVHEEALKRGVRVTGATVHYVNEIPDGGKIILQKAVRVFDGDTPERLQQRVMRQAEWKILPRAVEKVAAQMQKTKTEKNI